MKVLADFAGISALDVWLRDAQATGASRTTESQAGDHSAQVSAADTAPQPRDTAETLLTLDVWSGSPDSSHHLAATAPAPRAATQDSAVLLQHWAEHIFSPLL